MNNNHDLIIIGGGAAGLIAGISAKTFYPQAKVTILEKNDACGKKLLITGKGRCNITTSNTNIPSFIEVIGKNGKWLRDALTQFSIAETIDFFVSLGIKVQEERGNRIFPESANASFVRDKLIEKIKELGVEIRCTSTVKEVQINDSFTLTTKNGHKYVTNNLLIATGGLSYPTTGSTGDGYLFAQESGHTIITPTPSLIGIKCQEVWIRELAGLTLNNVKAEIYQNNKKHLEKFGDLLFTHVGVSGPIILDMSKDIHHLISSRLTPTQLSLDLKPAVSPQLLDARVQRICQDEGKKNIKSLITKLLPGKMIDVFIALNKLDANNKLSEIKKEERIKIITSLKKTIITLTEVEGFDKAIITSGGVSLKEVNPKNMEYKMVKNLFLAGEVLDLDGPTGGYNLQIAWSTGYLVGKSIICS
ncbi:MAG: NAD(P)/FAD-dependent oxidoreductase [Candidatus Margulisbacteria bacterium]|nr:NAD(P)/FAD-dependent oxidoreductase [Candidatus Margulisiibacteriota bacterium]